MKAQRLLPLCSALFLSLAAAPAFAGSTSVNNSWNLRDITGGKSRTNIKVDETYKGTRKASSSATKTEWGVNIVTDNLDAHGNPTGEGPTLYEYDSYDITATSSASEKGGFKKTTSVGVHESYEFEGLDKSHTVTSSFSF